MAKGKSKGQKNKKSKKSKKSGKSAKPKFKEGEWEFTFPNEDHYKGHFCAHVSGLAWRQGPGLYISHDDHIYEGNWKDDKLNESENLQITFENQDKYIGKIHKFKYNGPGTYSFRSGSNLTCVFSNNKPTGEIIFIDHHGELWYGKSMEERVELAREHIFSYELDNARGKGRPLFTQPKEEEISSDLEKLLKEKPSYDMKYLEEVTFAKSTKTPAEIDFEDSDWVREYNQLESILDRVDKNGLESLTPQEKNWYNTNILRPIKIQKRQKEKRLPSNSPELLKQYFEEILHDTCPPTRVFYLQSDCECEEECIFGE